MNIHKIKYLAVLSMILDHMASVLFAPDAIGYIILKLIGRIAAPAMCFALAQGFIHTSDRKKYFLRLIIFAGISQIPYSYYMSGSIWFPTGNMLFTLACSFLLLEIVEYHKRLGILSIPIAISILYIATFTDWFIFGPLFTLSFYLNKGNKDLQALCHACISFLSLGYSAYICMQQGLPWYSQVWQIGVILFIPIIYLYNGKPGNKSTFNKWFFYLFYPLHLVVIGIIRSRL